MNKIEYQLHITYDTFKKLRAISFSKNNDFTSINFHILTNTTPALKLNCYSSDNEIELYEYGINYIIDNKIAKCKNIEFMEYTHIKYFNIIIYFDIIDREFLLQLI